jgi:hypothetical protein
VEQEIFWHSRRSRVRVRPATAAGRPLPGEPDLLALGHAGWDTHVQGARPRGEAAIRPDYRLVKPQLARRAGEGLGEIDPQAGVLVLAAPPPGLRPPLRPAGGTPERRAVRRARAISTRCRWP